jgi:hypothetical protein
MEYVALIYADEDWWGPLPEDERSAVYDRYRAFASSAEEAGVMRGGSELGPTSAATTVRIRGGETLVTDGPYAEVKEALGGYFLFECESMEEALDWAARIPGAEHGAIEVRPIHVDPEEARL